MQRKIAIGVFIILAVSIIVLIAHKNPLFVKKSQVSDHTNSIKTQTVSLPVAFDSSNVNNVWISYVFRGPVKEFGPTSENEKIYRLVIGTNNKSIPALLTNEKTLAFKVIDNALVPAVLTDIIVGLQVDVSASYNVARNSWSVGRIVILPDQVTQHIGD